MACVPTPTETVFADVFTTTVIQTVSESVTVLPPTVTTLTLVSQSCSPPGPDVVGDGCVQVQVTTTSTVNEGQESIVQVPVALTIQVPTSVPTTTLFAPCDEGQGAPGSSSLQTLPSSSTSTSPSRSDSLSSTLPTTATDTWVTTTVTPISISKITIDGGMTMSDGSVYPVTLTMTSTFSPTAIVIQSDTPHTTHYNVTGTGAAGDHEGKSVVVPVVAGVLGGFFGFIALVVAGWIIWRKRQAIFSDLDEDPKGDMGYYSPSHSVAHDEPQPKPFQYGLVGRPSSHPSPARSPPSASSPELALRHSYGSLPYQDVPYSAHNQRPSSSVSQLSGPGRHQRLSFSGMQGMQNQIENPRYYTHSSSPSLALYQGHSRTPTGNSTTPLLAGHLNTSEFGQILNANASQTPGSRPSTAGRYDSAYSHSHQQSVTLPPGAAPPPGRQSWPDQPNQQHPFPELSGGIDGSLQSRNRSSSNQDLRPRNAESFPSSKRPSLTTSSQDLTRVSQGAPPSSRVDDSGTDSSRNKESLIDDDVTPTLERPHNSVLYVVNATSPRSVAGNLPS
ncbi:hypothetical protein QCA50_020568 [Cerrena zonata]|uniref:Uncharacterized protein n=1 Tax=Cerrena zonata TaxID=2478898 RepID=A0AAW0FEE4_9APHY